MFRYYISYTNDPYVNLATEQYLFRFCNDNVSVLFLWQNDHTIVIGKNQDPLCECKADEFIASGGHIARRRSGGGAVYHDLGNLNYSVISTTDNAEECRYQSIVIDALRHLNISAEYNGRNDITVCGRKFSGNAVYSDGNIICQHGTILVDSDIDKMQYFLTPDTEKLKRNYVNSVSARVINLNQISPQITCEDIRKAVIKSTNAAELEFETDRSALSELISKYSCSEWIYGGCV